MGLDPSGVWRPLCGLQGCPQDVADDGFVEVDTLLADSIRTARVQVCENHAAQYRGAYDDSMSALL